MELEHLIIEYTKQLRKNPTNAELYYNRGVIYTILQENLAAIQDFNLAIQFEPALADAYRNRATVYIKLKEYEKSLQDCNTCITLFPESADAYYNRATVYYHLKNYPAALKDWDKVIALQSGNGEAYFYRGNTYLQLQDYTRAIEDFDVAARIKPDYADEWIQRGQAKMHLKDYEGALADFEKAQSMGTKNYNPQLPFLIAKAKVYAGKSEEALPELLDFIKLSPTAEANYELALVYHSLQNDEVALTYAREATFLDAKQVDYWVTLALIRIQLQDFEAATKDLATATKLSPDYWLIYYSLGKCKFAQKKYKAAVHDFDRAIKLHATHIDCYYQRAMANYALKAYPDAITDLNAVLKEQPEHTEALHLLIEARWQLKQYAMTVEELSNLIVKHEKEAKWYYFRAIAHQHLGKFASAVADFNAFEQFSTQSPTSDLYYQRCMCYLEIKEFEAAKRDFETLKEKEVAKAQEFTNMLLNTLDILFNLGKYEMVIQRITHIIQIIEKPVAFMVKQAQVFQRLKRNQEALNVWEEIIALSPHNASFYFERGLLYESEGKMEAATNDFAKIQTINPQLAEGYAAEDYQGAKLKVKSKNYAAAVKQLTRCLLLFPNYGLAYLLRGECFVAQGEQEKALLDYANAYLNSPKDSYQYALFYANKAKVKIDTHNFRAAQHLLSLAIALNPEDGDLHYKKGLCHEALRENKMALQYFEAAYMKGVFHPELSEKIKQLQAEFQPPTSKVEEQEISVSPTPPPINPTPATTAQTIELLTQAIQKTPNVVDLYLQRGKYYVKEGKYEAALQDFELAVQKCNGEAQFVYQAINATFEAIKLVFAMKSPNEPQ